MASSYSSKSSRQGHSIDLAPSVGILVLRLGTATLLGYMHAWSLAQEAWQHLWHRTEWPLIQILTEAQMPFPQALALLLAFSVTFASVAWATGFVTRLASFLTAPLLLIALIVANRTTGSTIPAESAILYFTIAFTLWITGPGVFALDTLFKKRPRKKKSIYA